MKVLQNPVSHLIDDICRQLTACVSTVRVTIHILYQILMESVHKRLRIQRRACVIQVGNAFGKNEMVAK